MEPFEMSASFITTNSMQEDAEPSFRIRITKGKFHVATFEIPMSQVGGLLKGEMYVPCKGMLDVKAAVLSASGQEIGQAETQAPSTTSHQTETRGSTTGLEKGGD